MKKSLLVALFAAMPLLAQECPKMPECGKARPCCAKKMNRPQLSEEQKAEMKAKFEARKAEMHKRKLELEEKRHHELVEEYLRKMRAEKEALDIMAREKNAKRSLSSS